MTSQQLAPLPVVIPLLAAAAIAITAPAPRRFHDVLATAAAAATTVICALLLVAARDGPVVSWLAGWRPHHGVAVGIAMSVDQLGAAAALLASLLLTATLVYSWFYFDELDGLVHALMLVLTAGMAGICLTGDLFTIIVFFVLTTVAGIGLTAVENEHRGPLQGAINFAVVNSVAGFSLLFGVALVYGRTGALNLAQISVALDHRPADALVAVAFVLLVLGLLTKAGIAPFHFWLPDTHAVAPTPVSALLAGALGSTMLLAVARLLSTAFAEPLAPHYPAVRAVLVVVGAATALIAALNCFEQRHIKRLLAFAVASQAGVMLCGVGLLRNPGLAGSALLAAGFGLVVAGLFGAGGVLLRRFGSADELALAGRGRDLPLTAACFVLGGLVLASLPPSAIFAGRGLIEQAARDAGYAWLPPVLAVSSAFTAAGVLRVAGRVFVGWGAGVEPEREGLPAAAASDEEEERSVASSPRPPIAMAIVSLASIAAAVVLGAAPGFADSVQAAAVHFRDLGAYRAAVLAGHAPRLAAAAAPGPGGAALAWAAVSLLGALALAWAGLRGRRVMPLSLSDALHAAHSGHIGDYVAWWTFGMAVIGGVVLWAVAG